MKSNEDSPKTPSGIRKTLLTPCRRVGLSRKYNRKGSSPFISPLCRSQNNDEDNHTKESKKTKICSNNDELISSIPFQAEYEANACISSPPLITATPSRKVPVSKKISNLSAEIKNLEKNVTSLDSCISPQHKQNRVTKLPKSNLKQKKMYAQIDSNGIDNNKFDIGESSKKTPTNLTKECIVLIQNKFLTSMSTKNKIDTKVTANVENGTFSQTLSDSDSDDLTLCKLNKKQNFEDPEDDFVEKKLTKNKIKRTSVSALKTNSNIDVEKIIPSIERNHQITLEDDDDFELIKRTTIVKKTYDKIAKPSRAKSTGSITQNDIDELTARIDKKKKLLIAKAMTEDTETEDIRNLIKKWQKGCQDALFELIDLMKMKCPDNHMNYSEILKTLKIPAELVGYDDDNDCFITPNDINIILGSINT